ncbi:hypothetical protein H7H82_16690, partial [Mycobacterium heidelbergense]|uniref:hypothetical protein n=1 Tax=Mycobacterium heidelbergense TaxID=53376 RepID=UPI0021F36352
MVSLQEIVGYLQGLMAPASSNGVAHAASNGVAVPAASNGVAPVAVSVDLVGQMLDVVADKTGYPVEMLDLSMAL